VGLLGPSAVGPGLLPSADLSSALAPEKVLLAPLNQRVFDSWPPPDLPHSPPPLEGQHPVALLRAFQPANRQGFFLASAWPPAAALADPRRVATWGLPPPITRPLLVLMLLKPLHLLPPFKPP
jgi:hypothetical protein